MRITRIALFFLTAGAVAATEEPPTPASTAPSPAPQETSSGSGNLLGSIYQFAKGLGLTRCVPYALPLVTTLPRLPPGLVNQDLISQALSQTTLALDDVCAFSVTGAVGDVYTGFLPAWYSWHHAHTSTISEILKRCPSATALVRTVEAYESCSQVAAVQATATVTESSSEAPATTTTDGAGGGSSAGSETTADPPEEAPTAASQAASLKDTCLVVAPAVAVGLLVGVM